VAVDVQQAHSSRGRCAGRLGVPGDALFFRRHPDATPLKTSLVLVAIVIGLDASVVAPVIEHSYVMFRSPLGTWIPFASIGLASFLVGRLRPTAT
jgi:hypothetical protein